MALTVQNSSLALMLQKYTVSQKNAPTLTRYKSKL